MAEFTFTSPDGKKYVVTGPEGATQEQAWEILQRQMISPTSTMQGLGRAVSTGLAEGGIGLLGLPADAGELGAKGLDAATQFIGETLGMDPANLKRPPADHTLLPGLPGSQAIRKGVESVTGPLYKPQTVPEEYARTIAEFAPGMLGPGKGVGDLVRKAVGVVSSGAASEAAGQLPGVKGTALEPYVRVAGALAGPGVARAGELLVSPVTSQIAARVNPAGFAEKQFGRIASESGMPPATITAELQNAAREGQGSYAVADVLGNAGREGLSPVTRSPGPGRERAVKFLEDRQHGQGRRVSNILSEGFNAPETALFTQQMAEKARKAEADINYAAARSAANPVDVTPAIDLANAYLKPGATGMLRPATGIADNSIEAAVTRARSYLTDGKNQVSSFRDAHQAKIEIDNIIETSTKSQQRILKPIRDAIDDSLASASSPYAHARDEFHKASKAIEAIPAGRKASQQGRHEDVVREFNALQPQAKQPFRVGYVDPEIARVQGAPYGVNKARPYTSDAFTAESNAIAPNAAAMQRQLARENTMFETRNRAMGGSRTFDNFANADAMGVLPELVAAGANVAHGNWGGVLKQGLHAGRNALTGNTPAVRSELGRLLLMNAADSSPSELARILSKASEDLARRRSNNLGVYLGTPALEVTHQNRNQ